MQLNTLQIQTPEFSLEINMLYFLVEWKGPVRKCIIAYIFALHVYKFVLYFWKKVRNFWGRVKKMYRVRTKI
jgi:hypothetical protein